MTSMTAKERERLEFFEDLFRSGRMLSLDGGELLSLASKFRKIEAHYISKHAQELISKRIGILSSYTTHHFVGILKLFLYREGIRPEIYEGEYDGIAMDLMNPDSGIYGFGPEILLLLTYHTDIKDYPSLFCSDEEMDLWLKGRIAHYQGLWSLAAGIKGCHVFQTLFVPPIHRQLGNLEGNYHFSPTNCLKTLNTEMVRQKPPHITFIDMDYIASAFGKYRWFDDANYFMSKQGFSFDAAGDVSHVMARMIASQAGKVRKCLVLDLDNTLWGGVIGDDGLEGINLNPNNAVGEAYLAFQKYVKKLKERGVILAVCSKNDEETAKAPFREHPDMFLKLDDIACFVANWNDKTSNIREIASRLNIGLDSLVFFDDNPAEREIVRQFIPEVEVIDAPEDPVFYVRVLERSLPFELVQLSEEDLGRSDTYVLDQKRNELQSTCIDYDAYLRSLDMSGKVAMVSSLETPRFTQLINKTNQFNFRTRRYTEAAVEQMRNRKDDWRMIYISVSDKFGNYGIISAIVMERVGDKAFVDTWVMSCRVLKRGVERAAMNAIGDVARSWGCDWIVGEYLPSKKNGMVKDLYREFGFEECANGWFSPTDPAGSVYRLKVSDFSAMPHHIKLQINLE